MSYHIQVNEGTLNYRDNRDRAHTELRNIMRRVSNIVDDHISFELAQAEHEGREADIDLSRDGLKRLIVTTVINQLGGGQVAAING
ncbi:MAG TPA: hypothetical protein VEM32_11525 [Geobacteraceae bacterium]|nr:hypothetical protein [Geobacteraceae bacterium]